MRIAIVGATGLVGTKMMQVLLERHFPITELIPVASDKSAGGKIHFAGKDYILITVAKAVEQKPAIVLFSAGSGPSLEFAPQFVANGSWVIDNSSAWRMNEKVPLIVPEINADAIGSIPEIIANPNCSTIQMVMALNPLHKKFGIKRIVVSTYQSVSGTGIKAIRQMDDERGGKVAENPAYPHHIDMNVLPHIDVFLENGFTKEEIKMVNETRKIMRAPSMQVNSTCVRVPVSAGHSESVNVEFEQPFELHEIYSILRNTSGVIVQDDIKNNVYPMPLNCADKDEVFVGRIRRDESIANGLNLWIVADNLRKGAATNAVQIAQYLLERGLVKS
ncbi:MAG: aspartate-semialdehyde dehydrogenase [Flavobacteriaceae bacterium]|nr:aspartate-semialdehyde dehydrogenase [Flavobacteriaceae bacterium]